MEGIAHGDKDDGGGRNNPAVGSNIAKENGVAKCVSRAEIDGSDALARPEGARDLIGDLISVVERVEQRIACADTFVRPCRFPWAPDEEIDALENEMAAIYERYR